MPRKEKTIDKYQMHEEEDKELRADAGRLRGSVYYELVESLLRQRSDLQAAEYLYNYGKVLAGQYNNIIEPLAADPAFDAYRKAFAEGQAALTDKLHRVSPDDEELRRGDLEEFVVDAAAYNVAAVLDQIYIEGIEYISGQQQNISKRLDSEGFNAVSAQIRQLQAIGKAALLHEMLTASLNPDDEAARRARLINTAILAAAAEGVQSDDEDLRESSYKLLTDEAYRKELRNILLSDSFYTVQADSTLALMKTSPEEATADQLSIFVKQILDQEKIRIDQQHEKEAEEEANRERVIPFENLKKSAAQEKTVLSAQEYYNQTAALQEMGGRPLSIDIKEDETTELVQVYTVALAGTLQQLQNIQTRQMLHPDDSYPDLPFREPGEKLKKLYQYLNSDRVSNEMILKAAVDIYNELEAEKAAFAKTLEEKQLLTYNQLDQLTAFNDLGSPSDIYFSKIAVSENESRAAHHVVNVYLGQHLKASPEDFAENEEIRKALLNSNDMNTLVGKFSEDQKYAELITAVDQSEIDDAGIIEALGIDYRTDLQNQYEEELDENQQQLLGNLIRKHDAAEMKNLMKGNLSALEDAAPGLYYNNLYALDILLDGAGDSREDIARAGAAYVKLCGDENDLLADYLEAFGSNEHPDFNEYISAQKYYFTVSMLNRHEDLNEFTALRERLAFKILCGSLVERLSSGVSIEDHPLAPGNVIAMRDKAVSSMSWNADLNRIFPLGTSIEDMKAALDMDDAELYRNYTQAKTVRLHQENDADRDKQDLLKQHETKLNEQQKVLMDRMVSGSSVDELKQTINKNLQMLNDYAPDLNKENLKKIGPLLNNAAESKLDRKAAAAGYLHVCGEEAASLQNYADSAQKNPQINYKEYISRQKYFFAAGLTGRIQSLYGAKALREQLALKILCGDLMSRVSRGQDISSHPLAPGKKISENRDKAVREMLKSDAFVTLFPGIFRAEDLEKLLKTDDTELFNRYDDIRKSHLKENEKQPEAEKIPEEEKKPEQEKQPEEKKIPGPALHGMDEKDHHNVFNDSEDSISEAGDDNIIFTGSKNADASEYLNQDLPKETRDRYEDEGALKNEKGRTINDKNGVAFRNLIYHEDDQSGKKFKDIHRKLSFASYEEYCNLIEKLNKQLHGTNHTFSNGAAYNVLSPYLDRMQTELIEYYDQYSAAYQEFNETLRNIKNDPDRRDQFEEKKQELLKAFNEKTKGQFERVEKYFKDLKQNCMAYLEEHRPKDGQQYQDLKFSKSQRDRLAVINELLQVCDLFEKNGDPLSSDFSKERMALKILNQNAVDAIRLGKDYDKDGDVIKNRGLNRKLLLEPEYRDRKIRELTKSGRFRNMCSNAYDAKTPSMVKALMKKEPGLSKQDAYSRIHDDPAKRFEIEGGLFKKLADKDSSALLNEFMKDENSSKAKQQTKMVKSEISAPVGPKH